MSGLRTALAHINTPPPTHFHRGLAHLAPPATAPGILDMRPTRANAEKLSLRADLNHFPAMFKPSPEPLTRADHPQHFTAKLNLNTNWPSLASNAKAAQLSEDSFLLPYDPQTALEILPGVRPVQLLNKAAVATGIPARVLRDELVANLALMPLGLGTIKAVRRPLQDVVLKSSRTTKLAASHVPAMDLPQLVERFTHLRTHTGNIIGSTMAPEKKAAALKKLLAKEIEHLQHNAQEMGELGLAPRTPTTRLALQEREVRHAYHDQLIQVLESGLKRVTQIATK